jgi:ferrous iron transport protein B
MKLSQLNNGSTGYITEVNGDGAFRKRITEMGFVVGKEVRVIKKAPLQDPVEYSIMGYNVSIRHKEAEMIDVVLNKEDLTEKILNVGHLIPGLDEPIASELHEKTINVALVGNPNCGKTTLFNFASNSHERVANYTGVTVSAKEASVTFNGYKINFIDLPGTYSMSSYSPEELFVSDYLLNHRPDIVLNVIDASNLERNLYLTTQLIDLQAKVVVALNMYDELQGNNDKFDHDKLGKMLGIPFVPTIGTKGKGVKELFQTIVDVHSNQHTTPRKVSINYGTDIEKAVEMVQREIEMHSTEAILPPRFIALKLLEKDSSIQSYIDKLPNANIIKQQLDAQNETIKKLYGKETAPMIVDAKYGFIAGALAETYRKGISVKQLLSQRIDFILTHKWLGLPVFFGLIWLMFYSTFTIGTYPMDWIDSLVSLSADGIASLLPNGIAKDLVVDGILGGVGGVIIFLPNIMILFLFISLMEDTGYMARTAFLMDRVMHKAGLHGKSFIPLLMGFGCNVPAVMATRTIESRRDRLLTMLVIPFMSCSARLPVYVLFISAFFPHYSASIMFGLYLMGIFAALGTASIFSRTVFKKAEIPFVMELPPYRMPTLKAVLKHMWYKSAYFLKKMGGIILIASIVIWALSYFPRNKAIENKYTTQMEQVSATYQTIISDASSDERRAQLTEERDTKLAIFEVQLKGENLEQSILSRIGKTIEPVFAPLGFDWKMTVNILTGIPAKEIVVSSMGVLYQVDANADENSASLISKLQSEKQNNNVPLYVYLGFLAFTLLYSPCLGTLAAIRKETENAKWMLFTTFYTTAVAWIVAFTIFWIGKLFF